MEKLKKYNLHMKLEHEGANITINDIVNDPFNLKDYVFQHDLEIYTIIEFNLKEIEDEESGE